MSDNRTNDSCPGSPKDIWKDCIYRFIRAQHFWQMPETPSGVVEDSHEHHEVIIVINGQYEVKINETTIKAGSGTAFFFSAGLQHLPICALDWTVELIVITIPTFLAPDLDLPRQIDQAMGRLLTVAHWLCALTDTGEDPSGQRRVHMLPVLIDEYQARAHHAPGDSLFEKALRRMSQLITRPNVVSQTAHYLGISRTCLHETFIDHSGRSPQEHIKEMRAHIARELIQTQGLNLQETAAEMGHVSPRTIDRLLRSQFGMSFRQLKRN